MSHEARHEAGHGASGYVFRSNTCFARCGLLICRPFAPGSQQPHVVEWWGDPEEQFALVRDDLDHPAMDQFIVAVDDRPFAYLQCYDPSAWPNNGFGAQPTARAAWINSSAKPI